MAAPAAFVKQLTDVAHGQTKRREWRTISLRCGSRQHGEETPGPSARQLTDHRPACYHPPGVAVTAVIIFCSRPRRQGDIATRPPPPGNTLDRNRYTEANQSEKRPYGLRIEGTRMTQASTPRPASLLPREHGAYAQISFPLLTALALGTPRLAAILLVAASVAVFLAHEPILVLVGGRGGRAMRDSGKRARQRATLLLAAAFVTGVTGLWLAAPAARLSALIPLGCAIALTPLILSRREKTTVGELLVALGLSSTMIPVAIAAGVSLRSSLAAAGIWATVFALGTITVRAIIAGAKRGVERPRSVGIAPLLSAAVTLTALLLAFSDAVPTLAALAVVPTALVALLFSLLGVHPRNLRRMGWSLVASNIAVLAALIVGLQ